MHVFFKECLFFFLQLFRCLATQCPHRQGGEGCYAKADRGREGVLKTRDTGMIVGQEGLTGAKRHLLP